MTPQFCTKCGKPLNDNGNCTNPSCEAYSSSQNYTDPSKASENSTSSKKKSMTYPEKGMLIVPECIRKDVGEVPIKQYDIATLRSLHKGAFAEGRLQVTNKRILFRASGRSLIGPTCMQHEFSIEEIAGIEIRKEASFNLLTTVLMGFVTLFIMSPFQTIFSRVHSWGFIGTIVLMVLAAAAVLSHFIFRNKKMIRHVVLSILLAGVPASAGLFNNLLSIKAISSLMIIAVYVFDLLSLILAHNLAITFKTKGGSTSIEIRKKDGLFSRKNNDYTGFSQVIPGPDVDKAMKELGALIREVQLTGSYSGSAE